MKTPLRGVATTLTMLAFAAMPALAQTWIETPSLEADVTAGKLPPVAERLPATPLNAEPDRPDIVLGQPGGELKMLIGTARDVRMMVVYGYARLVGYNAKFEMKPDILESIQIDEQKVFTLKLRRGHRWSDGHPFTAEDFRYWWEDVTNNKQLSPLGPPTTMLVDGQPPVVEFIDEVTIRYSWPNPNPYFLPALANPAPLYIYRPAHYMKQFHAKYADKATLDALVKQSRIRNWQQMHNRLDGQYRNDNPDMPTLDPWAIQTKPPADRYIFVRNPYFHRVDAAGRQLPYIDRVVMNQVDGKIIPLKAGGGETDLQARNIAFNNYTFLRESAKRIGYSVHLWNTAKGSHLALYPNLNVEDPVWRQMIRDVRFRRALSLALNRHELNQVIYYGLALEGANTVLPASPLHKPQYRSAYAAYDIKQANRLLDEIGLTKRDGRGVRLMPDGRPLEIIVETAGEDTEQTDVLQLVHDSWLLAGIKLYSKPLQREVLRNRVFAGFTVMSIWSGIENGLPSANMSPEEFTPTTQQQLQWPQWGQHVETKGNSGEQVDDPPAMELFRLNDEWRRAATEAEREKIWARILEIHAEQVYSIGTVADVRQPVVVSSRLRNVPNKGVYNWDPGAFFGIYRPDLYWVTGPARTASAAPPRN